jgi:hypothetical protein
MLSGFAGRYQYSGDRDGDEDSTFLWNVGIWIQVHMALQPRIPTLTSSPLLEPQASHSAEENISIQRQHNRIEKITFWGTCFTTVALFFRWLNKDYQMDRGVGYLRNAFKIFTEKCEGKRPLGRHMCRWKNNINLYYTGIRDLNPCTTSCPPDFNSRVNSLAVC